MINKINFKLTINFTNLAGSLLILTAIILTTLLIIAIINDIQIKPSTTGQIFILLGTFATEGVALMTYRKYVENKHKDCKKNDK